MASQWRSSPGQIPRLRHLYPDVPERLLLLSPRWTVQPRTVTAAAESRTSHAGVKSVKYAFVLICFGDGDSQGASPLSDFC